MMRKVMLLALMIAGVSLSACKTVTKKDLGLVKEAPNEFMVMSRAPLSMPPEYDVRPVNEQTAKVAQISEKNKLKGLSSGERQFMKTIGAECNNDNIRAEITEEMKAVYE